MNDRERESLKSYIKLLDKNIAETAARLEMLKKKRAALEVPTEVPTEVNSPAGNGAK